MEKDSKAKEVNADINNVGWTWKGNGHLDPQGGVQFQELNSLPIIYS